MVAATTEVEGGDLRIDGDGDEEIPFFSGTATTSSRSSSSESLENIVVQPISQRGIDELKMRFLFS
jgi:hypothetical protein